MVNTSTRVEQNSSRRINQKNQVLIDQTLERYSHADSLAIDQRLEKLDREWTTERLVEVESPLMIALGSALTLFFGRKFIALPVFSASMLLVHALKGWYPLLPLFRKSGFRTQNEIMKERRGLRALQLNSQINKH